MIKQKLDPLCLDFGKEHYESGKMMREDIKTKEGIDKETAEKIVKKIKDAKLKVEAQIVDEQVCVSEKRLMIYNQ